MMKTRKIQSLREYFPSILLVILGLSLFMVQCKDKMLNSPVPDRSQTASDQLISRNYVESTSLYDIKVPDLWNGNLVVYAHGYVNPQDPLAAPHDSIDGSSVADIVNSLGMAYAATSYPHNGLNGPEAVNDLINLVSEFEKDHPKPTHIYLVGVSEGALVTTLAVEQHPQVFSGGLAGCGPIGDFRKQLNYFGDFHVLFHYFFPKINVGNPEHVDDAVINSWLNGTLQDQVKAAVSSKPMTALTLLNVANVPVQNSGDVVELTTTILALLRYNVLATNDAITRLGGHPFDNSHKYYRGTGSFIKDRILNRKVDRYTADATALQNIEDEFQTSGDLTHPLVTIHTSGDQIIPYWHEPLYSLKVLRERDLLLHSNIPITGRYGHCNFTLPELLTGFGLMVFKVSLQDLLVPSNIFTGRPGQEQEFLNLSHKEGINPKIQRDSKMLVPN